MAKVTAQPKVTESATAPVTASASLLERVLAAGVELSPEERDGLRDLELRLDDARRRVLRLDRPMSLGEFLGRGHEPSKFSLAAMTKNQQSQTTGA